MGTFTVPDYDSEDSDYEYQKSKQTKTKKKKRREPVKSNTFKVPDSDDDSDDESDAARGELDSNNESNNDNTPHQGGKGKQTATVSPQQDITDDMEVDTPSYDRAVRWLDGNLNGISTVAPAPPASTVSDQAVPAESFSPIARLAQQQSNNLTTQRREEHGSRKRLLGHTGLVELMSRTAEETEPDTPERPFIAPAARPLHRTRLTSQTLPRVRALQHARALTTTRTTGLRNQTRYQALFPSSANLTGLGSQTIRPTHSPPRVLPGGWPIDPSTPIQPLPVIEARADDPEQPLRRINIGLVTTLHVKFWAYLLQVWYFLFPHRTQVTAQNTPPQQVQAADPPPPQQPTTDAVEVVAVEMHGGTKRRAVEATSPSPVKPTPKPNPKPIFQRAISDAERESIRQMTRNRLRNEAEIAKKEEAERAVEIAQSLARWNARVAREQSATPAAVDGTSGVEEFGFPTPAVAVPHTKNAGSKRISLPTTAVDGTPGVEEFGLPTSAVAVSHTNNAGSKRTSLPTTAVDGAPGVEEFGFPTSVVAVPHTNDAGSKRTSLPTTAVDGAPGVKEFGFPTSVVAVPHTNDAGFKRSPPPRPNGRPFPRSRRREQLLHIAFPDHWDPPAPISRARKDVSKDQSGPQYPRLDTLSLGEHTAAPSKDAATESLISKANALHDYKGGAGSIARMASEATEQLAREEEAAKKLAEEIAAEEARQAEQRKIERAAAAILHLSDDQAATVLKAIGTTAGKLIRTVEKFDLKKETFDRIISKKDSRGAWLDDEAVNAWYAALVRAKNLAAGYNPDTAPKSAIPPFVAINSGWYGKATKDIQSITRWLTRARIGGSRILQCQRLFLPINSGSHWTLLIINGTEATIEYLDSLGGRGAAEFALARNLLKASMGKKEFHKIEWEDVHRHRSSMQGNVNDCGVFTCMNGLASAKGLKYQVVKAREMPQARMHMAGVLVNGGFTGDYEL